MANTSNGPEPGVSGGTRIMGAGDIPNSQEGAPVDEGRRETKEYTFPALSKFDRPQLNDDEAKEHLAKLLSIQSTLEEEIRFAQQDVEVRDAAWAAKVAADEETFEKAKAALEESKRKLEAIRAPTKPKE